MSLPPLYLIVDRATCEPRSLDDVLTEALDAGVRLVQLREKGLDSETLENLAERILRLTDACHAELFINTHAEIAVEIGAAGVHLPARGLSPQDIGRQFGAKLRIGCSVHNAEELDRAVGADFVTFSPVYSPSSKPVAGVGPNALREAVRSTPLPVYALGGITPERVPACRFAGAAGIAVMSGILQAEDVGAAVRDYLDAWENATTDRHR
jgi:thiamine-phosphate pyrophosphorylase